MMYGVASAEEVKPTDKIKVLWVLIPVAYFVKRVAGPLADVNVLIGPGQDRTHSSPHLNSLPSWRTLRSCSKWGSPSRRRSSKRLDLLSRI